MEHSWCYETASESAGGDHRVSVKAYSWTIEALECWNKSVVLRLLLAKACLPRPSEQRAWPWVGSLAVQWGSTRQTDAIF